MKPSSIWSGRTLPESAEEYEELRLSHRAHFTACMQCKNHFSAANTTTPAGWRETQISGVCEACFDNLFKDED